MLLSAQRSEYKTPRPGRNSETFLSCVILSEIRVGGFQIGKSWKALLCSHLAGPAIITKGVGEV